MMDSRQSNRREPKQVEDEDGGGDPLSIVLRERIEALEARYARLADEVEIGDDTVKRARLRFAREYINACWEHLDEGAD
jgi:hypothetical protein